MANHPKLTPDQITELKRLWEEGESQAFLAKKFGVSITTVRVKLGLHPASKKEEKPAEPVSNPLHAATEQAIKSLPILLREGGSQDKKKEPPKRRIVGVNI
jgi:hypothetical protein